MAKRNRKFLRKKGVKISIDEYTDMALEIIANEDGPAPATLWYDFVMKKDSPEILRLKNKMFSIIDELKRKDNCSHVAA